MGLCASRNDVTISDMISTLIHVPLFSHLEAGDMHNLARAFRLVTVEAGEVIFREGDEGDSFFVVSEGRVRVTALGKDGEPSFLAEWSAPHAFGEIALLRDASKRTASVVAEEAGVLMVLTKKRWNRLRGQAWMEGVWTRMANVANHRMALFLREISFLSLIDDTKLEVLGSLFSYERAQKGAIVCAQGEAGDTFYIISRGSVRVTTSGASASPAHITDLGEGQYFGEMALLANTPRTATVTAKETCMLLCLQRDAFTNFLKMVPDARRHLEAMMRQRAAVNLKTVSCPLFQGMTESQLKLLANLCDSVTVEPGHVFFRQGDAADAFYVVTLGTAKVCKDPAAAATAAAAAAAGDSAPESGAEDSQAAFAGGRGRASIGMLSRANPLAMLRKAPQGTRVASLRVGDYFGEVSLLFALPRTATVVATSDCSVLRFSRAQFHHIFTQNPAAVAEFVLRVDAGALTLELTLLHAKAREFFRRHLDAEFSAEALEFFMASQRVVDDHKASPEDVLARVRALTDTYIRTTGDKQVNIRDKFRREVETLVDGTAAVAQAPPSLWADQVLSAARQEVFKLMERDGFPRFKEGTAFTQLLVAGGAYCMQSPVGAAASAAAAAAAAAAASGVKPGAKAQVAARRASTGASEPDRPAVLLMTELAALPPGRLGLDSNSTLARRGTSRTSSLRSIPSTTSAAAADRDSGAQTQTIAGAQIIVQASKTARIVLGIGQQRKSTVGSNAGPKRSASAPSAPPPRAGAPAGGRPTAEQRARDARTPRDRRSSLAQFSTSLRGLRGGRSGSGRTAAASDSSRWQTTAARSKQP